MLPDLTGLTDYVSTQVAAVLFIIMIVMIVRAFISQRWGQFFSSFIFAVVCYVISRTRENLKASLKRYGMV